MTNKQQTLEIAKQNLDERLKNLELWEKASRDHIGNQQKAEQAAHGRRMVEDAREQLKQAEAAAAIAANPTSPQAIKELKQLEKVNKEGLALTLEITQAADELGKKIEKWHELQAESKRLANRYDMKPYDLGIAGSRLTTLGIAITRWQQEIKFWDREKYK